MFITEMGSMGFLKHQARGPFLPWWSVPAPDPTRLKPGGRSWITYALLVLATSTLVAQTSVTAAQGKSGAAPGAATVSTPVAVGAPTRAQPPVMPRRAALFYDSVWGVDSLDVRVAESGELVRFSWRVLDATKAKMLSDKKLEPSLIAPSSHVKLVIPSLEKVGQLRQSSTPEVGKSYWMAFSNPGRLVKHGDRVDIMIGAFRAEGLTVD